jgi:CCR4-NOT transcriptional regulation complex NOT5 subunit
MKTVTCYKCASAFAMPDEHYAAAKASENISFYCSYGHRQIFSAQPSEADKLRRERDRLKQKLAQKDDEIKSAWATATSQLEQRKFAENQARAFKGVATRMKNRVSRGVCPCCNRTFSDLQRHMASKHKGFAAAEVTIPDGATVQ